MGIAGHGLLHQIHTGAVESGRIQKERDSDYDNTAKNHAQIRIRCYKIVCSARVVHDKAEQDAYECAQQRQHHRREHYCRCRGQLRKSQEEQYVHRPAASRSSRQSDWRAGWKQSQMLHMADLGNFDTEDCRC